MQPTCKACFNFVHLSRFFSFHLYKLKTQYILRKTLNTHSNNFYLPFSFFHFFLFKKRAIEMNISVYLLQFFSTVYLGNIIKSTVFPFSPPSLFLLYVKAHKSLFHFFLSHFLLWIKMLSCNFNIIILMRFVLFLYLLATKHSVLPE